MTDKLAASGIILAGGRSSRMGQDKTKLDLGGVTLAQRSVNFLQNLFIEIIYVTNQPHSVPWSGKVIIVEDEVPYQGPLGGILAGLQASENIANFVVAVDMPFINEDMIKYIYDRSPEADVVVPKIAGKYEPLHAFYSKNCLKTIRSHLKKNDFRMISFYNDVKTITLTEDELRRYDPQLLSFFNINTWDDYYKAQDIYQQMEHDEPN